MLGDDLAIVCCESGIPFGTNLVTELQKLMDTSNNLLIPSHTINFASTSLVPEIDESIRGKHVVIVADCENHTGGRSNSENFDELTQMISAARSVSAERLSVFIPMQPDSRQDKANGRQPITCALRERDIENHGSPILREILHFDLHNKASTGFTVNVPIIPLYASKVIIPYIRNEWELSDSMFFSCDLSRAPLARYYGKELNLPFGAVYKLRDYSQPNKSEMVGIFGNPMGKRPILVDDMICNGRTMLNPLKELYEMTGEKIRGIHVHSLFNAKKDKDGKWFDPVEECRQLYSDKKLEYILGTDTVYNGRIDLTNEPWYQQVSVAGLAANIIYKIHTGCGISSFLE